MEVAEDSASHADQAPVARQRWAGAKKKLQAEAEVGPSRRARRAAAAPELAAKAPAKSAAAGKVAKAAAAELTKKAPGPVAKAKPAAAANPAAAAKSKRGRQAEESEEEEEEDAAPARRGAVRRAAAVAAKPQAQAPATMAAAVKDAMAKPPDAGAKKTAPALGGKPAASMTAPAGRSSCLPQLAPDLLALIWRRLDNQGEQRAWRRTCRGMREATAKLITGMSICVQLDDGPDTSAQCTTAVDVSMRQLKLFPSDATLQSLAWECDWRRAPSVEANVLLDLMTRAAAAGNGGKLANLKKLRLKRRPFQGGLALQSAEVNVVASACPLLEEVAFVNVTIHGPALVAPLQQLQHLRRLTLTVESAPECTQELAASLGDLTQLTALSLTLAKPTGSLSVPDFLPHIERLTGLQTLELGGGDEGRWRGIPACEEESDLSRLRHLSSLTNLTALTLPVPWEFDAEQLSRHITVLAHLPLLATLRMDGAILDSCSVRVLAALPHLTKIWVGDLECSEDLSALPCHWEELSLTGGGLWLTVSAEQLLLLPLSTVTELYAAGVHCSLSSDLDSAAAQLLSIAQLLQRCWPQGMGLPLSLEWDDIAWDDQPPAASHQVLAALAPLAKHCVILKLLGHWADSSGLVQQLELHLPRLYSLDLQSCMDDQVYDVAAALATSSFTPQNLVVGSLSSADWEVLEVLLRMACARASHGVPLVVVVPSAGYGAGCGAGPLEIARCNAVVAKYSRPQTAGRVQFRSCYDEKEWRKS